MLTYTWLAVQAPQFSMLSDFTILMNNYNQLFHFVCQIEVTISMDQHLHMLGNNPISFHDSESGRWMDFN
jgi:hypothetical protein